SYQEVYSSRHHYRQKYQRVAPDQLLIMNQLLLPRFELVCRLGLLSSDLAVLARLSIPITLLATVIGQDYFLMNRLLFRLNCVRSLLLTGFLLLQLNIPGLFLALPNRA